MSFIAVIDISSIIWDQEDYETNTVQYYELKNSIITLIEKFKKEKPFILIRPELVNEMIKGFPYDKMPTHFWEFGNIVYSFLGDIEFSKRIYYETKNDEVESVPNIIKAYFKPSTKDEVKYILTHNHTKRECSSVYFTFRYLWEDNYNLTTSIHGLTPQENETIIIDKNDGLDVFFQKFKRIFEHSSKHHKGHEPGDYISPLSCYDGHNKSIPQKYLDESVLNGKKYYNFDTENKVYVVFFCTHENVYHGHDEIDRNKIPPAILKHYNK